MLIMPYGTESKSRNADFMFIARKGDTATLGAKGPVKLKNPWAEGPSILRTFPFTTLLHNPRRQPRPFFKNCGEAATTTLGLKGRQT